MKSSSRNGSRGTPRRGTLARLQRARYVWLPLLPAAILAFTLWGRLPDFSGTGGARVLYEVPEGVTASGLARDLHEKGLIAFPRVFKAVLRVTGWQTRLRAGFYYLPPRNSVMDLARKLTSGEMATRAMTIPEGKASWEIFDILKRYFPLDEAVFDSLVNDPDFAHSLGIEADGLEGYLYPDTYIVPWKLKEADVIRLMVTRFQEVTGDLDLDTEFAKEYGLHGVVTLASIVEKEAAVRREQRTIAGVFQNRLRKGWSLGADPTVRFALRKLTAPLRKEDLATSSPYNTRRFTGLPPGPICSPGESALRAALAPSNTRMMFFVAKDDGSREHYFTATYAEHNAYKDSAAVNRERMRILAEARADSAARAEAAVADKTGPASAIETPRPAPAQAGEPVLHETREPRAKEPKAPEPGLKP
ncbi:MAG TPA: endolytic transglycosylase MltG [Fibrobacteria bacterium]|nr:endolytic transglycosylase MltG [Fibrobacteria bacterium]